MKRALSLDEPLVPEPAAPPVEEPAVVEFRAKLRELEQASAAQETEIARRRLEVNTARQELLALKEQKAREAATAPFQRSPLSCDRFEPVDRFMERCLGCGGPRVGHNEKAMQRWVEWSSQQGRRRR